MNKGIPCSNKIVFKKINERNRQIHLQKLNQIKSSISRDPPSTFNHLKSNKKKHQQYEEKLTEIERENRILLEKLTHIMKTQPQAPPQKQQQSQTLNPLSEKKSKTSLNKDYRKRELVKITIENQAMLKRLKDKKSTYDRSTWMEARRQNEKYLKNISEYPLTLYTTISNKTQKSPTNDDLLNEKRPQTFNDQKYSQERLFSSGTKSYTNYNQFYSPNKPQVKRPQKLEPMVHNQNAKEILYQTKKKIGFSTFLIHIYLQNQSFNILASNNDRADFKHLTIPEIEGKKLLERFHNNYELLVNQLRFAGNKIMVEDIEDDIEEQTSERYEERQQSAVGGKRRTPGGLLEIQDDNDENDSFEESERRAKMKQNTNGPDEGSENRKKIQDNLIIPEENQKDETESNIKADNSRREEDYEDPKKEDDQQLEEDIQEDDQ